MNPITNTRLTCKPLPKRDNLSFALRALLLPAVLLGLAEISAAADVPPPQSYTLNIQPGWNVIANQLSHGGNSLGEVLPSVPSGSLFYRWELDRQSYSVSTYDPDWGGWDNPSLSLNPGEGGFFHNPDPAPSTITFVGETVTPHLPLSLPPGQLALVARQIPAPATYEQITGLPPAEGAKLYRYDPVLGGSPSTLSNWQAYTFSQGQWIPATPTVGIGEPVFIQIPTPPQEVVIAPVSPIWVHQGEFVQTAISASGPSGNFLAFSINAGELPGVQMNPTNGLLTWDTTTVAPGTYQLTVEAVDQGHPMLQARQTISATVSAPLRIQAITRGDSQTQLIWNCIPGRDYVVQSAADFSRAPADWAYQGVLRAGAEFATWTPPPAAGRSSSFYAIHASVPLTLRPIEDFRRDITMVSGLDLLRLLMDLNRRKDYDYAMHGGTPGPDSAWLWERIQAIMDELTDRGWTFPPGDTAIDPTGRVFWVR